MQVLELFQTEGTDLRYAFPAPTKSRGKFLALNAYCSDEVVEVTVVFEPVVGERRERSIGVCGTGNPNHVRGLLVDLVSLFPGEDRAGWVSVLSPVRLCGAILDYEEVEG